MKSNESKSDRAVRVIVGVIALVLAFVVLDVMTGTILGILAAIFGLAMILTGSIGYCPGYRLIGISTCKKGDCGDSCGCNKE